MKIRVIMLGRTRQPEVRALMDEYVQRISRYADIETKELREASDAAARRLKLPANAATVLLDAGGRQFTSAQFAKWLGALREGGPRELIFLCGDADGFPEELRRGAKQTISLSALTMPHEIARVVLAEQIYRAFTILTGHPYPK
jgi:23S rRNA (pseudouridine1915-N3)-methyltransferase